MQCCCELDGERTQLCALHAEYIDGRRIAALETQLAERVPKAKVREWANKLGDTLSIVSLQAVEAEMREAAK